MIEKLLKEEIGKVISDLYPAAIDLQIVLNPTPKNFTGDYSLLVFPYTKYSGKSPESTASEIAEHIMSFTSCIQSYNIVKGYLNFEVSNQAWLLFFDYLKESKNYGSGQNKNQKIVIEYASPNTNKPLHLGHIRNNLLGHSTATILSYAGFDVKKVQIINDRGIHICKSMLAWKLFGNNETPQTSKIKGDHLVGKYYVLFEKKCKEEFKEWMNSEEGKKSIQDEKSKTDLLKFVDKKSLEKVQVDQRENLKQEMIEIGFTKYLASDFYKSTYFNQFSHLGKEAKKLLQLWEEGESGTMALWNQMNSWVYEGFEQTYNALGVNFDKLYYESETYVKGKSLVEKNLKEKDPLFFRKDDGSVWIDLQDVKLDEKVVLRSDGTSMYITQDLGTAAERYADFDMDRMIYVVGNEQEYHFKVLFEILKRLGHGYANNCFHLSYGMVELPEGKMKSREGTVVDADDLIAELIDEVGKASEERSTLEGLDESEKEMIRKKVALSALKFYILKVEPKKGMIFDPKQSIDLQGHTGPYIQNAYVRTQSACRVFRSKQIPSAAYNQYQLEPIEKEILVWMEQFPNTVDKASESYSPAEIANYLYQLAKLYHQFWNLVKIVDDQNAAISNFRYDLSQQVAKVIRIASYLLGMEMPDKM